MWARGAALVACLVAATSPAAHAQPPPACEGRPATIVGTDEPDTIDGTDARDVIVGMGGDDTINGFGSSDLICGGPGDDYLDHHGSDEPYEDLPEDELFGEDGDDVLYGDGYWSRSHGGAGDDVFIAGPVSYERATGPVLADTLAGDAFGEGRDTLIDVHSIYGSAFPDGFRGTDRIETFSGSGGNDRLIGLEGRDYLYGEEGDDVIVGGPGSDWHLHGGEGSDEIFGGDGSDTLYPDSYTPRAGLEPGDDLLSGGDGRDGVAFETREQGGVSVDLREGTATGHGADELESIEDVEGSDAPDSILGDEGPNYLQGGGSGDLVSGLAGNDRLDPGDFDRGVHRRDRLYGGSGRDILYVAECCGGITPHGGKGRDLANFEAEGSGRGVVVDLAEQTYSFEDMDGRLSSIEDLWGTIQRDVLLGDDGPDFIRGDYGSDVLRGRGGDDVLFGGGKEDEVYGGPGRDRCKDLEDRLSGCERTPG